MKKMLYFSMAVLAILLVGLSVTLVSAVGLPELPKPSIPSLPPIPSVPGIPAPPAGVTTAAPATLDQRIEAQQKKIDLGLKTKLLTKDEGTTLQDNLKYIKAQEARAKKDGLLDAQETEWLARLADQNNKMIDNKKTYPVKPLRDIYYEMRFDQHQEWIKKGVASGDLTKEEANEVQADLDKIKARYAKLMKDGKLSSDERERLNELLAHNTRMIRKREQPPAKK